MKKSSHDPETAPIYDAVARYHARHTMRLNACNYSQHLSGIDNIVTDCLSRDFALSDIKLKSMLTSLHTSLNPNMIQIVQVPVKITSWIASLAQLRPGIKGSPKARTPRTLAAGISGWSTLTGSSTAPTPIWKRLNHLTDYVSAVLSCMRDNEVILEEADLQSKLSL